MTNNDQLATENVELLTEEERLQALCQSLLSYDEERTEVVAFPF